jgi:FG-GAP-like repeat/Cysteine-rich secretory protein family
VRNKNSQSSFGNTTRLSIYEQVTLQIIIFDRESLNMMFKPFSSTQFARAANSVFCTMVAAVLLTCTTAAISAPNDFDLDGKSDLLLEDGYGNADLLLMNGSNITARANISAASGWSVSHLADFNGDGKSDILWRNVDGTVALWLMNGAGVLSRTTLLGAGSGCVTHVADFNGDGKADILWRSTDGAVAIWLMSGAAQSSSALLIGANPTWSVSHTADFNGDGKADMLWRSTDGSVATWLMNGTAMTSSALLLGANPGWGVSHTADFNGDGKADLLWRNTDGTVAAWLMNGTAQSSSAGLLGAGSGWSVTYTADLNGDGKADLLWRNADGSAAAWLMTGTVMSSSGSLIGAGSGWQVVQTPDLNGDKKADLIWRKTDGTLATWLMNGTVASGTALLLGAGTLNVAPNPDNAESLDSGTVAVIDRSNRQAVLSAYQSIYVPTSQTPLIVNGLNVSACAAGDTRLAYKSAVIRMANYYRAMAGIPGNVALNLNWSAKAQQAALMMNANFTLDHNPPTTWNCYSAAGAEAAGKGNLAMGAAGFAALGLYMSDVGVTSLGHRRWILYPPQTEMGTGDTTNYNSLWVLGPFGARPATPNGVAWPAAGFVPYALAPSSMAWSFSMDGANFAGTSVTVTKVGSAGVPVTVSALDNGYGDNTISFAPSGGAWPYATTGDTSFDVQVSNVIVSGVARNFSYRVTLIPTP